MPDGKLTPDDLVKTTEDDITLSDTDLSEVSGGQNYLTDPEYKIKI